MPFELKNEGIYGGLQRLVQVNASRQEKQE